MLYAESPDIDLWYYWPQTTIQIPISNHYNIFQDKILATKFLITTEIYGDNHLTNVQAKPCELS